MTSKQKKTRKNGFVLIVVLCMVIMLAVILFGFNAESRTNLRIFDNFKRSQQALNCARSGLNIAIAAIRNAEDSSTNKTLLSTLLQEKTFDLDNGTCSITIAEENGKLNINLLKGKNNKPDRTKIEQLLRLIDLLNQKPSEESDISYDIVPSIIDWTDNDNQLTYLPFIKRKNSGAESIYYQQLKKPYICGNRPLSTMQELLLVKGITMPIFNRIRDHVTVYSDGKININYASKLVIESLSEEIDPALAQMIINQRQFKLFDNVAELRNVPGMTDSVYSTLKKTVALSTTNQYYHVRSCGTVDGLKRTTVAILKKNVKAKKIEVVIYEEY